MHSQNNKQSGLALITVLFVFALISMLAVGIQQKMNMNSSQTQATLFQTQVRMALLSAEDFAKAGLVFDGRRDVDNKQEWDTASELWNMPLSTQLADTSVEIYIRDLQGLFNVNSLHPAHAGSLDALARLKRLFSEIGVNADIADNIREWLTTGSAVNFTYQNYLPPYSAAEIEFSHPSELRLIDGMDPESFEKIEPYIATLPAATALNINTTTGMILKSWDVKLTVSDADAIVALTRAGTCGPLNRSNFVFETIDDFWQSPQIVPLTDKSTNPDGKWDKGDFTVKSKYFSVLIKAIIKDGPLLILESIIKRDYDKGSEFVGVISRDFSRKPEDISRLNSLVTCSS